MRNQLIQNIEYRESNTLYMTYVILINNVNNSSVFAKF